MSLSPTGWISKGIDIAVSYYPIPLLSYSAFSRSDNLIHANFNIDNLLRRSCLTSKFTWLTIHEPVNMLYYYMIFTERAPAVRVSWHFSNQGLFDNVARFQRDQSLSPRDAI